MSLFGKLVSKGVNAAKGAAAKASQDLVAKGASAVQSGITKKMSLGSQGGGIDSSKNARRMNAMKKYL